MFGIVDLSRFTSLKQVDLWLGGIPFEQCTAFLDEFTTPLTLVLSTISARRLERLLISHCPCSGPYQPLDSALTTLTGLKDVDVVLSLPEFHRLQYVQIDFIFNIVMLDRSIGSGASHSTSSSAMLPTSSPCSQSSLDGDDNSTKGAQDSFRRHAESLIRSKIQEMLKQVESRGILNIELEIQIMEQTLGIIPNTESGQNTERPVVDPSPSTPANNA